MTRVFFLLLATTIIFTVADLPIVKTRSTVTCTNYVKVSDLECQGRCRVADILKSTGLSFLDFAILQKGVIQLEMETGERNMDFGFHPRKDLPDNGTICLGGYFVSP